MHIIIWSFSILQNTEATEAEARSLPYSLHPSLHGVSSQTLTHRCRPCRRFPFLYSHRRPPSLPSHRLPRFCHLIVVPVSVVGLEILELSWGFKVLVIGAGCVDDKPFLPTFQISKEKAKGLGIDSIPLDVSLKETVESLKEKKFFNF